MPKLSQKTITIIENKIAKLKPKDLNMFYLFAINDVTAEELQGKETLSIKPKYRALANKLKINQTFLNYLKENYQKYAKQK